MFKTRECSAEAEKEEEEEERDIYTQMLAG
jgi:hypothetical protein